MDLNTFIFFAWFLQRPWKIDPSRNSSLLSMPFLLRHLQRVLDISFNLFGNVLVDLSLFNMCLLSLFDLSRAPYNSLFKEKSKSRNKYIWTHQFTIRKAKGGNMLGVSKNGSEHFHFFAWFSGTWKNRSRVEIHPFEHAILLRHLQRVLDISFNLFGNVLVDLSLFNMCLLSLLSFLDLIILYLKEKVSRNKYIWTHQFTQKSKENMLGVSKNGSEHFHFFAWFSRDLKNRSKSKFILLSMPFYSGTSRECWI